MGESTTKWVGDCMFMGEYNHTIDTKGRLIIPSKFREELSDEFVVTKGLDGCLFVYKSEDWHAFEEKMSQLPLTSKEARKFIRFFGSGGEKVTVDKQGRILLPASLRKFADLTKDVVLAGVINKVEIWSRDRWDDASNYDDMDEVAERMADLGLGI